MGFWGGAGGGGGGGDGGLVGGELGGEGETGGEGTYTCEQLSSSTSMICVEPKKAKAKYLAPSGETKLNWVGLCPW